MYILLLWHTAISVHSISSLCHLMADTTVWLEWGGHPPSAQTWICTKQTQQKKLMFWEYSKHFSEVWLEGAEMKLYAELKDHASRGSWETAHKYLPVLNRFHCFSVVWQKCSLISLYPINFIPNPSESVPQFYDVSLSCFVEYQWLSELLQDITLPYISLLRFTYHFISVLLKRNEK